MLHAVLAPLVLALPCVPLAPQQGFEKRMILVQSTLSARPWQIDSQGTAGHIDSLPFDGFAYNLPVGWDLFRGEYGFFDEAAVRGQFGSFDHTFTNLTENFVTVYVRRRGGALPDGDFFDDAAWAETVAQMRVLARVAREPRYQCVGIVFDPEEYFEDVWNYPEDVAFAATHSLEDYRAKAQQRGRELAETLFAEWPAARILSLHGPYVSAPERAAPGNFGVTMNQVGDPSESELLGPFQIGFLEAAGRTGRVVDGGEVYQLRTEAEFAFNYCWRKRTMATSAIVPPSLSGLTYAQRTQVTFGIYPYSWPDPVADLMTPPILEQTIENAFRRADDWLWLYSEASRDFLTPGGIDQVWIDAVEAARRDADRSSTAPFAGLGADDLRRLRAMMPAAFERAFWTLLGC